MLGQQVLKLMGLLCGNLAICACRVLYIMAYLMGWLSLYLSYICLIISTYRKVTCTAFR